VTPRLYKAFQIKEEGRANLLLLFVILSSFHTLLLSQSCNFSANFPFQVFDKIRRCKYFVHKFQVKFGVFDPISSGIRASTAQID